MQDNKTNTLSRSLLISIAALLLLLVVSAGAAYGGYLYGRAEEPAPVDAFLHVTPESTNGSTDRISLSTEPTETAAPTSLPPTATVVPSLTPKATVELVLPAESPPAAETSVPAEDLLGATAATESLDAGTLDLSTFYEVWDLVEREFDGDLPENKDRLYGAISGSLEAVDDDYTRFIRPEIAERLREDMNGSVSGIGAIVRPSNDGLVEIVRPIDNQPADLAGLLAGDLIVAVDEQPVGNLSFDEVILMVRGEEGTEVNLTVVRDGVDEPLQFTIVRALFEVPLVEADLLGEVEERVAYVKLNSFTQTAEPELRAALADLLSQNPAGIILDLRDNGGGFLDQSVAVADLFLPEGIVLYERSSASEELDETFRSTTGDLAEGLPLAVLVNAGTASASEIVAGAIQDNGRGILVGEDTFGKGSVQHVHTLDDGSELRITIARWYTPNNRSISDEGVSPDIHVESPVDLGGEDDPQLQRAIEYIVEGGQ